MKNKFICIHGHFYQPPRENPWTEAVETEASASPYHDWNERIFHECYEPNTASPLLDEAGRVRKLLNNYEYLSFNFGPTLLTWMEKAHPDIYRRVIESDRKSLRHHDGHGNAIAQVYNHIIMPLASRRDQETQVRWGIADFKARFSRDPEGMWLAETAVHEETLEVLIAENIRFTILSPIQAAKVRPISKEWTPVTEQTLDTTRPYRWFSKEKPGRFIDLFFYHNPIAKAISFERLLNSGDDFARRLLDAFTADDSIELVHVATDGENYGHHHRFGNMALSYAIEILSKETGIKLVNYGEFLSIAPPDHEVEIHPKTAWSCAHGVGRWQDDCGCSTGAHPHWNQKWRQPLREALDGLASEIDSFYTQRLQAGRYIHDPWAARDAFVLRDLDASAGMESFFKQTGAPRPTPQQVQELFRLCEMERQRLFMFTSCGWFFDDISGIEPVQILTYAARAIDLAVSLGHPKGSALQAELIERLARCPSNEPKFENGAEVFRRLVAPRRKELKTTNS